MATTLSPAKGKLLTARPAIPPGRPTEDRWFADESAPGKRDGTIVDQVWLNTVSALLRRAFRDAAVAMDDGDETMLSDAIVALAGTVAAAGYLPLVGGILTGALTLAADGVNPLEPVTVRQLANVISGTKPKGSARYATAAALPANTRAGNVLTASANGALAVDGGSPALNELVLVKNEATAANAGLYVVTNPGGAAAKWVLTRATNMDDWSEVPGAFVIVEQGTANADTGWVCTSDQGGTINTTAITWSAFFGPGMFQAANALLAAIAGLASNGLIARTAAGTAAARSIAAGTGGVVTNGDGVAGNPTVGPDIATTANYRAATANKMLEAGNVWTAAGAPPLTDAATIAVDFSAGFNFYVTLGGNRTLGTPTNMKTGQTGSISIFQDGTGSRTLAFSSAWKFAAGSAPALSTAANAWDKLYYTVEDATAGKIHASLVKGIA